MTLSATQQSPQRTLPPLYPGAKGFRGHNGVFFDDTIAFLSKLADEHPQAVRLRFGPVYLWVVSDPQLVRQVLITDQKRYRRPDTFSSMLKAITPESLFVDEGEVWRRQRRALQPAFHRQQIAGFGEIMAAEAQKSADRLLASQGKPVDVQAEMVRTALEIVGRSLFSVDMYGSDQGERLSAAFDTTSSWINYRFKTMLPPPLWVPTPTNRSFNQARTEMRKIVRSVLDERRRSGVERHDFLQMLMEVRYDDGTGMSDEQIVYESASFFFAGHETTANTLSWASWLLATHPEAERTLWDEVDSVLGVRAPTVEDLGSLKWTRQVIDEALRLYPPAWSTSRQPIEDEILGDYHLPKADHLILNFIGMHRSERFFDNALSFRPQRFGEELTGPAKSAYMPFGAGPRLCIGFLFAQYEAQMVLATLAQQLQLRPAPGFVAQPDTVFTLRVKDALPMVVTPRR
jgi:cytochrome P450